MNSLIVDENETLRETITKFSERPELRGIFILDKSKKLKGVVTRIDLLNLVKIIIGKDLGEVPLRILYLRGLKEVKTKDVASVYSKAAFVKLEDLLENALKLMTDMDLVAIPIVDDDNNIIGDLKLSDILLKLYAASEK
jgi:CBS-domain-containing membrane protein